LKKKIVIELDPECKALADAIRSVVAAVNESKRKTRGGCSVDYAAVESTVSAATAELERAGHEAILSSMVPQSDRIEVQGKVYSRCAVKRGVYRTLSGEVSFDRPLFREVGVRNGEVLDPIALRTGSIGEGWLPSAARAMSHLLQHGTSRDAEMTARELGRLPYSRSSFERVPHLLAELLVPHQAEIEEELIKEMTLPEGVASVSAAIDRVSVPMEEPRARPVGRPRKNAPKKPIERNFRMAYCGAVTLHDAKGEAIHTIRYGRMPKGDALGLAEALASDVIAILKAAPDLPVSRLADGSQEMWDLLESELDEASLGKKPQSIIDFWHLVEKLAAAARVIHKDAADRVMKRWRDRLRKNAGAAKTILRELRRSGMEQVRVADSRPVHEAITYIQNHQGRMNYAAALEAGLPIGSGNVEATCKSLVEMRMKRAGSRWKEETGHHVMQLRAFALSDRWEAAMGKLFERLRTPVRRAA